MAAHLLFAGGKWLFRLTFLLTIVNNLCLLFSILHSPLPTITSALPYVNRVY